MNVDRTQTLSDYLDGELASGEARALEARLAEDEELAALLAELRLVRRTASERPVFRAPASIWEGVERQIGGGARGSRRLMFTLPQLAAAAGIVLLLGVSLGRMSETGATTQPAAVATGPETSAAEPVSSAALPGRNYAAFVADLESRLDAGRGVLAPETARVLEESLTKIDSAIAQAQTALENDPNNVYLNQHLASARARKLRLLAEATTLIASRT